MKAHRDWDNGSAWQPTVWEQKWGELGWQSGDCKSEYPAWTEGTCWEERGYSDWESGSQTRTGGASVWTPGNSRGLHPPSWMEIPELADAVSFLIKKLLSSGIPPRSLAKALRDGADLLESDLESEQAPDAKGPTAVVSHTLRLPETSSTMPDGGTINVPETGISAGSPRSIWESPAFIDTSRR